MSTVQKRIVIGGCLVVFAMLVFPPWATNQYSGNYGFIFDPPNNDGILWSRLLLQVFAAAFITGAAAFLTKEEA